MVINPILFVKGLILGGVGGWVIRGNKDAILSRLNTDKTEFKEFIEDITEICKEVNNLIQKDN